jgi:hypothetical protein
VRQGRGGFYRESSQLPIGRLGVVYDSQPHGYALFFMDILIRVNIFYFLIVCWVLHENLSRHVE